MPLSDHNGKASFNIGGKEFTNQAGSGNTPIYKITSTDSGGGGNIIGGHGGVIAYCFSTARDGNRTGSTSNPLAVSFQGRFHGGAAQGQWDQYKNETTETLILLPIYSEPTLQYFSGGFWSISATGTGTLYRSHSSGGKIVGTSTNAIPAAVLLSNSGSNFGLQAVDQRNTKGNLPVQTPYIYVVFNELFGFTGDELKTFFNNNTIAAELSSAVNPTAGKYIFYNW